MKEIIPQQELEMYQKQVVSGEEYVKSLEVKTEDDYQSALIHAKSIKEQLELIADRKEQITKPLNMAIKSVRGLFKPLEDRGESILFTIKSKMLSFTDLKEKKAKVAMDKIDARVEKGTLSQSEANVKKFLADVPKTVSNIAGSATTKKVKKYYIVDKAQIPLEFLEPDLVKIRASYKSGFPVPGVEERLENELSLK